MRIGVDAHYAVGSYQGILTYLRELYGALSNLSHRHEIVFFLPSQCDSAIAKDWSALGEIARFPGNHRLARQFVSLATAAQRARLDILHTQTVMPFRVRCRTMVTVHDLLYLTHPQFFSPAFRCQLGLALRRTAKNADLLLPVSRYTFETLEARFHVGRKSHLVPNGVNHDRFNSKDKDKARDWLGRNYGVRNDFVLTVGRMDVRKNHPALIDAYQRATAAMRDSPAECGVPDLVLVGQKAYGSKRVLTAGHSLLREGRLKIFSNVPTADLPYFYKACTVFAFPSLAEGFGIPPLEAMACGAPVVACNTTAVAEVVGKAGMLVDPQHPDELADCLTRMLTDRSLRESYSRAAIAQASQFSWQRSAKKFLAAIERLDYAQAT